MTSSEAGSISHQLYCWDSIFDTRRVLSSRHNDAFDDVRDDIDVDDSLDLITFFMQAFDENDVCRHATDTVVDFCEGADLFNLQRDQLETAIPIALLNGSEPLTAWGLFRALSRRLSAHNGGSQLEGGRDDASTAQASTQMDGVDREISRLYITTLNRWTVVALAASSPDHSASVLGEFIFHHLHFDPLISAKTLDNTLPIFAFEFHLPYFALRKHKSPQSDRRIVGGGKELRKHYDITFLRTMDTKHDRSITEYVYEAKISCLVSGLSRYAWSAYLFNDLYFEVDDSESVPGYHAQLDAQPIEDPIEDPLAAGKQFMNTALCEPREYFLMVFAIRVRQVKKEWQQLFIAVEEAIQSYISEYWNKAGYGTSSKGDDQKPCSNADKQRTQSREEFQEWMKRTAELLRMFIGSLKQTIEEWSVFSSTGINYFNQTDSPERLVKLRGSLKAIDRQVTDLGRLLSKLKHTRDCLCEDMSRDVNLRIAHESNESALFQQKTARDVKVLTWITFFSLPVTLAAGLLSTQEGFIPITPSPLTFVASVAVLEILIWLILGALIKWDWVRAKLEWVRLHFRIGREGAQDIELLQMQRLPR